MGNTYRDTSLKPSALIVEDEEAIVAMLRYNLEKQGFKVRSCGDGEEAIIMIAEEKPDIILLDWMLPSMSGVEVCKVIRSQEASRNIPVIMISAKGEEMDRVSGLNFGADDYIVKPFSPNELMARIKAVFRRIRPAYTEKMLQYGDLIMDIPLRKVTRAGKAVHLGPIEFSILQCLMEYPERVMTRERVITKVWPDSANIDVRTIDTHIARLRKALSTAGEGSTSIRTVRSVGYSLEKSDGRFEKI